jgi:rfaE bifunctional protein nucleotidyltransferase chain/domain
MSLGMQTTNNKRVFVNGTFDVLHVGHVRMLKYAASLGNLLVALDSDERVREKKGNSRPFFSLEDRIEMISSIRGVLMTNSFSTDEELANLIKLWETDYLVVGSDWKGKKIIGSENVKNKIIYFDRIGDYSTTNILKEI